MEIGNIIPHIEALVFASDKPLTSMEITELINNAFGFMEEKLTLEQIQTALDGIIEKYASEFYPFEVRESGGGWQFLTKKDYHKTVAQLNGDKFLKRLSSAALETLSIIAYKQPITKGEIESIRGVSSDYSIQKLLEKELIVISGRNENMVGKPLIYTTSKTFMDYFGINSAEDLPKLKEVFLESLAEPTLVNYTPDQTEGETNTPHADRKELEEDGEPIFSVSEEGELLQGATIGPDTEESDEQADEDDGTILNAADPEAGDSDAAEPDATADSIPPYADDDLAAEPANEVEAKGEEAFGEADEEGDDEAADPPAHDHP
jgi:segregation and condensation protein B